MKKILVLLLAALTISQAGMAQKQFKEPKRPKGQTDMLLFAADPIPVVKIGFVGLGMRGKGAVNRMMNIPGTEVKAICDLEQFNIDETLQLIKRNNSDANPKVYTGSETAWKQLCEQEDLDLIYICTDWNNHTPIAIYGMEKGKHVAIEVPATTTVNECWDLVNTSERTRKHCMMLENCCYDGFELATLNMAQKGLFGEIVHVEGAYIHDLRSLNFNKRMSNSEAYAIGEEQSGKKPVKPGLIGYWDHWRLKYNEKHTGNPYATHGLGPVCQILNIHRGDKMDYLVSVSSGQYGMTEYANEKYGEDSEMAKKEFKMGDMNTTIIKTAKGKTIMIQHNVTNPRPYSRIHGITGTKGFAQKYPATQIALNSHSALPKAKMDSVVNAYYFPFAKDLQEVAKSMPNAHGGMDYIMDARLIYCLQNGLPLDQDVYDAAEWSCLGELTEWSTLNNGAPVKVPDFTRGAWNKVDGFKFHFAK